MAWLGLVWPFSLQSLSDLNAAPSLSVEQHYHAAIARGQFQPDVAQQKAVHALELVYRDLVTHQTADTSVWSRLFKRAPRRRNHGVYLYGPVGRGKSMLMQFFLDAIVQWNTTQPERQTLRVERQHFHAFMLGLHQQLYQKNIMPERMNSRLGELADDLADRLDILCFDEFHVTDVADAMLLMPYFTRLIARGVTVIATSNVAPQDLYKNGLQRQRFLPFIDLLRTHLDCVEVAGLQDYRLLQWQNNALKEDHWLTPLDGTSAQLFDDLFATLAGYDTVEPQTIAIAGQNRSFCVERATRHVAFLSVDQVTSGAVGAADFLALAEHFKIILLDQVIPFQANENDKAKRFMLLIDTLYEAGTHVYVRAGVQPTDLYPASGRLGFEFARTVSRLQEMRYKRMSA